MSEEEYQRRIDSDPSVRRLSARTVREREKAGMAPEERNPRGAGRKRDPITAPMPSVTMRIPGELADDIRLLADLYRQDQDFVRDQLRELTAELQIYINSNNKDGKK